MKSSDAWTVKPGAPEPGPGPGPGPDVGRDSAPVTRAVFLRTFDRCFDRVYAYVNRRIDDRAVCERVVHEVLEANLQMLVDESDDVRSVRVLKTSSDERIAAARTGMRAPSRGSGQPAD